MMAAYYGNRSIAHLKTESYGYALADASKALELDSKYVKASEMNYCNPPDWKGLVTPIYAFGVFPQDSWGRCIACLR